MGLLVDVSPPVGLQPHTDYARLLNDVDSGSTRPATVKYGVYAVQDTSSGEITGEMFAYTKLMQVQASAQTAGIVCVAQESSAFGGECQTIVNGSTRARVQHAAANPVVAGSVLYAPTGVGARYFAKTTSISSTGNLKGFAKALNSAPATDENGVTLADGGVYIIFVMLLGMTGFTVNGT